ncbi:hypothetical protein AB0H07_39160 [Streptomyces sp. NPDC021354]|uniref:hypothetical protein n=1 Tax=Streptomyces sp. NPDC021354 TaxID=3154793 RepID=UPI0033F13D2E
MFKTLREQFRANQELKRRIRLEEWEQQKRWREEDRSARQKALQDNSVDLAEHNANLKTAAGVSYLTLICHEDTWTFVAVEAFGLWKPVWTQSNPGMTDWCPDWAEATKFTVPPNLPMRRITKQQEGMQKVILSGHNLVRILDTLREGTASDDIARSARCMTLYGKFAEFVALVDPEAAAGQTTGIEFRIDDSVAEGFVDQ